MPRPPLLTALLLGFVALPAQGAGPPAAKAPAARKTAPRPAGRPLAPDALERHREALLGGDDAAAGAAAKELGDSGAPNAGAALTEALAVGVRPGVAAAVLESLGRLRDAKSIDAIEVYTGNRNAEVRQKAVAALGALQGPRVSEVLLEKLGDGAPDVRKAAAEALAARKETKAEARLFLLVRRNDIGAAGPLGALASPDTVARLAEQQGRIEDRVLATSLGEFLKRGDPPDPLRLEVVKTLGKIPGADATTALVEYVGSLPEKEERPSKAEAQKLVDQRAGGGK